MGTIKPETRYRINLSRMKRYLLVPFLCQEICKYIVEKQLEEYLRKPLMLSDEL